MLEKRVKSRFSHRLIHFYSPDQFQDFMKVIRAVISIHKNDDVGNDDYVLKFNESVAVLFLFFLLLLCLIYLYTSLFSSIEPGFIFQLLNFSIIAFFFIPYFKILEFI